VLRAVASLGRFGVAKDAVDDDTFDYFEHQIRVNPEFGELELADFLEAATAVDEENVSASMGLIKGTLRSMVHPDDFDTFWGTAKRERQGILDLMAVLQAVVEAVADRPTQRPSDSSDGPQLTSVSSAGGSSSRVIRRLVAEGRPSVALMVRQASEARDSAASA
jgi:hypothetical protein